MSPIGVLLGKPSLSVREGQWAVIVALVWGAILFAGLAGNLIPTQNWFDVQRVEVFDTVAGTPPIMDVERIIRQPFVADWLVEVERREPDLGFVIMCAAKGETAYNTDAELPAPLTLDWWTYPTTCALSAGVYRVETTWTLDLGFAGRRVIRVLSNTFDVKAKG